jgi:hypothetical protein
MTVVRENLFTQDEIQSILQLPEVLQAQIKLSTANTVSFSIPLTESIKQALWQAFQLSLPDISFIPCRWIQGDTKAHVDRGQGTFDNTYLVYLTDSEGAFRVGEESYAIEANTGFSFSEGLEHEVQGAGDQPRLLLGPMSEQGFAVGGSNTIEGPGGTTAYVRQVSGATEYSYDNSTWNPISFPITLNNSDQSAGIFKVYFTTNLEFSSGSVDEYFSFLSDKIQVGNESLNADGTRPTITISKDDYDGVFYNGASGTNGKNDIYIYNLVINGTGRTTQIGAGWLGRQYFGRGATNNYIINCSSSGDLPGGASGSGGILGAFAGSGTGATLYLTACSSSGAMGQLDGGIVGGYAALTGGTITCTQCWSTGAIGGVGAGGIFGEYAALQGTATATKCYSEGSVGNSAGGIYGRYAGQTGSATATSCYSLGALSTDAGGIFAIGAAPTSGSTLASNCYSKGSITTAGTGIYGTGKNVGAVTTNCYSANNSWSDSTANTNLTGTPTSSPGVGTTWASTASNTAYELVNFGATPYQTQTISENDLVQSYSQSVIQGSSSNGALNADASGNAFSILEKSGGDSGSYGTITISAQTGAISTTSTTAVGTYTLKVRSIGSYYITTFVLSVSAYVPPTSSNTTACCSSTIDERGIDYAQIVDYRIGNRLILEHTQNPNQKFDGYSQYVKYKMAQGSRKI